MKDWVPSEASDSVTSDTNYDRTIAASISSTLNAATFTMAMKDGVTDFILSLIGKGHPEVLPEHQRDRVPVDSRVFEQDSRISVKGNPTASFTVAAEQASVDFTS